MQARPRPGVGDLEVAGQRQPHADARARRARRRCASRSRRASASIEPDRARRAAPTVNSAQAARARRLDHARRDVAVGVDHRRRAARQQLAEQPQLGGEIGLHRRVIVQVVARQIGEGAGGEPHAVEPLLVEPVRGGLQREMGDAGAGELCRASGAARSGRASSASRRLSSGRETTPSVPSEAASRPSRRPDLAREGGDRGLAAGAGDGDDAFRAGADRSAPRRAASAARASATWTKAARRHCRRALGDDRRRAPGERVGDIGEAVVLGARRARRRRRRAATLRLSAVSPPICDARRAPASPGAEVEDFVEPPHSLPILVGVAAIAEPARAAGTAGRGTWSAGGTPSSGSTRVISAPGDAARRCRRRCDSRRRPARPCGSS